MRVGVGAKFGRAGDFAGTTAGAPSDSGKKFLKYSPAQEKELMLDLWTPAIADDPLAFVRYVYPWGKRGTPLESFKEPRKWQCEDLDEIGQHIADNKGRIALDLLPTMFRKSTVSGRGPGKSVEVAWLVWWFISTRLGSTTIVTANGESQLRSRTWPEIGKWATLALNGHWFKYEATSLRPEPWFGDAIKRDLHIDLGYYYAQAQLWRQEAPDAFAGAHNLHGLALFMDEASGIPHPIFSVSEGFFTEPTAHRYWLIFSNGRRNSGPFYDTHHSDAKRWRRRQLDSRTVEGTDPAVYDSIIEKYGPDSDEARVEVYGQFPNQSDLQFIPSDRVYEAQRRAPVKDPGAALIMGVDLSRGRKDKSVIRFRQGRDALSIPPRKKMERDSVLLADWIAQAIDEEKPDGVCIDGGDLGGAICDILKSRKYAVHEIGFGGKAEDKHWDNKGTEMWADMREWLMVGCIDSDPALAGDLIAREKRKAGKTGDKAGLESKDDMRGRGVDSPDDGDALALTFGKKFARRDHAASRYRRQGRQAAGLDYNVFGE